jgi:hypothetical protein
MFALIFPTSVGLGFFLATIVIGGGQGMFAVEEPLSQDLK